MSRLDPLVVCATLAFLAAPVFAESALDQAVEANRGYLPQPPPVSKPMCVANCGGAPRTVPRTTARSPSYGYKPSMAIGAAVFGSLLEGLLSSPADRAPDPEVLRRQKEAREQAEEEARRRAEEERIRHEHLLSSLKSMPLSRSFSATPGTQGATELGLTALRSLDSPTNADTAVTDQLNGNAERLRSEASQAWDTADTRFAVRWQPLPLAKLALAPPARPLCQNKHCTWPIDVGSRVPHLLRRQGSTHILDRDEIVQLLRKPGRDGLSPDETLVAGLMARIPEHPGVFGRYVISEKLMRFSDNAAKALIWVIVAKVLEKEGGALGEGIILMSDVYDLASTDLQDAIKVAGWLGSSSTDNAPEITSPEEASIPFLNQALGHSDVFGKKAAEYASDSVDASQLANKMLSLWHTRQ